MNLPSIPPRVQDNMTGTTSIIEGVLMDFPAPILPKTGGDRTRETLIEVHRLKSGNVVSMMLKIGGGRQICFELTMTTEDYMA